MMTKNVNQTVMETCLEILNIYFFEGRAEKALELHQVDEGIVFEEIRQKASKSEERRQGVKVRDY